jgi:hypothetical protein
MGSIAQGRDHGKTQILRTSEPIPELVASNCDSETPRVEVTAYITHSDHSAGYNCETCYLRGNCGIQYTQECFVSACETT